MEISIKTTSPVIKSPTNFKSKIPQKIEATKTPTSPTAERFQSKIPRSTSLKYSSSFKNEVEVLVQRPASENREQRCGSEDDPQLNVSLDNVTVERKCQNVNSEYSWESVSNGKLQSREECHDYQASEISGNGYESISNRTSCDYIEEYLNPKSNVLDDVARDVISDLHIKLPKDNNSNNLLLYDTNATNEVDFENCINNTYIIVEPVHREIHPELPSTKYISSSSEITDLKDTNCTLNKNQFIPTMQNETTFKAATTDTHSDDHAKNGFSKPGTENFQDEDFERTEHDNNDYTTTTTTEYEKDGKIVKTTETINYTNDRNIKTRVTTTEKIVTIPYGQQLDLSSPEITSSTTVRSKYLQTMLQSREFEGDKEVKAETFETIETDVQTDKVDSNDATDDPDLDTILTIVETLDEVRTVEPKIKEFSGTSATELTYTEILNVLNAALSKFDNIEHKGKQGVEQKRQNGIDYIQRLIEQLNTKLQANQLHNTQTVVDNNKTPSTQVDDTNKSEDQMVPKPQTPKTDSAVVSNLEKPLVKEAVPEDNNKKERKKSTLKKHFKLMSKNKDKQSEELQEKKKKKKLCVIS